MKKVLIFATVVALLTVVLLIVTSRGRVWTNADGSTMAGTLQSYDKNTGNVEVLMNNGKVVSFHQSILSGDDREFLRTESAGTATPVSSEQ